MSSSNPADYIVAGCMIALYRLHTNTTTHSVDERTLVEVFGRYFGRQLSDQEISYVVRRMQNLNLVTIIADPYAADVMEISDSDIAGFFSSSPEHPFAQAWKNEDWLKSAFENQKLWDDFARVTSESGDVERVPSADGFVTADHNSAPFVEAEAAVVEADEALRGDNEFEEGQRSWIRAHLEAGIALLKRGGPVLKAALLALIVEPLKAALKATTNEKVKTLIGAALTAFLKWFGL